MNEIPYQHVDCIDELEQLNYELSKELLKDAFKNYFAKIDEDNIKKKTFFMLSPILALCFIVSFLLILLLF